MSSKANDGFLLDTDALSELTKARPNKGLLQWLGAVPEYRLYLSVLTIGELVSGVQRLPDSKRKRDLWTWLSGDLVARFGDRIVPIDFDAAHLWDVWKAKRGQTEARFRCSTRS